MLCCLFHNKFLFCFARIKWNIIRSLGARGEDLCSWLAKVYPKIIWVEQLNMLQISLKSQHVSNYHWRYLYLKSCPIRSRDTIFCILRFVKITSKKTHAKMEMLMQRSGRASGTTFPKKTPRHNYPPGLPAICTHTCSCKEMSIASMDFLKQSGGFSSDKIIPSKAPYMEYDVLLLVHCSVYLERGCRELFLSHRMHAWYIFPRCTIQIKQM